MMARETALLCFLTFTVAYAAPFVSIPHSVNQFQTGEWADCSGTAGVCIDVNTYTCSGGTVITGRCPGGNNILCCQAPGGITYGSCAGTYNGLCKKTDDCPITTVTGLCPGPSFITCCPGTTPAPTTVAPPAPSIPTDVPVTPGIYLELNPPSQTQFRERRASIKPVIVVHTSETDGSPTGSDSRAENAANYISTRKDHGSYHLLGDTDSIIQLVRFENAAFHDATGSNEWSVGISLAMRAADWPTLDAARRAQLVRVAAQMAEIAATWFESQGVGLPAARLLTKVQSDEAAASGFISHARRDPARRSDPGPQFPWAEFLNQYAARVGL